MGLWTEGHQKERRQEMIPLAVLSKDDEHSQGLVSFKRAPINAIAIIGAWLGGGKECF